MSAAKTLLEGLRSAVSERRAPDPWMRRALAECADPGLMRRAGLILADLAPLDASSLPTVRVAISATCTIGAYEPLLRACLIGGGILPAVEARDYGTFDMTLATGEISVRGDPDIVTTLIGDSYFIPRDWDSAEIEALERHLEARLADFRSLVKSSLARASATFVVHTVPLPAQARDGFISWRSRTRLARAWHRLNAALLGLAEEHGQIMAVDLAGLLADAPVPARDDRMYSYADMPYTDGALLILAQQVRRAVQARMGQARKVLALDLDNTLWGGVVGEVGAGGIQLGGLYPGNCYLALQRAVLRLSEQGVILVLASKNDAELVAETLAGHPEMLLRPDSFALKAVNWSAKAENLRAAAESLNLPVRSFVFMDDSAFERAEVSSRLPEVAIVPADGDPAFLARSLLRHGWFDVMTLTDADRHRAALYQARAERTEFSAGFVTPNDYLGALNIEVEIASATSFTIARVAQLAARTNQFNLTGIRFDEAATAVMNTDPGHLVQSISVSDRFGPEGITGAIWIERGERAWRVLNFVLSCRVLGRGIEFAAVASLARQAHASGAELLAGRFVPAQANAVAADFWTSAGFTVAGDGEFALDLTNATVEMPAWIKICEYPDM